jgi:hypothetical protein
VAARGAAEWEPARLGQEEVRRLADYLQRSWPADARETLWLSLPHLVAFLQRGEGPARYRPVYLTMLDLLAIEGRCGLSDLQLISDLVRALLDVGFSADREYDALIDDLCGVWERVKSPRFVPWLLDLVELLADYPAGGREGCLPLLRRLASLPPALNARLTATDRSVLLGLCERLGAVAEAAALARLAPPPLAEEEESEEAVWVRLAGATVGIYTLSEQAGLRARDEVLRRCPGCEVILNNDTTETPRLEDMARRADVVVVAWLAAKHAATNGIVRARNNRGILYPEGKGASSIVRKVREFAAASPPR